MPHVPIPPETTVLLSLTRATGQGEEERMRLRIEIDRSESRERMFVELSLAEFARLLTGATVSVTLDRQRVVAEKSPVPDAMSEALLWQATDKDDPAPLSTPITLLSDIPHPSTPKESFPARVTFIVPLPFPLNIHQTHTLADKDGKNRYAIFILAESFEATFYGMQRVVTAYLP